MADAFLGVPIPYALNSAPSADATFPGSNLINDEPGLVYRKTGTTVTIDVDLTGTDVLGAVAMMGIKNIGTWRIQMFSTAANRTAGTPVAQDSGAISPFISANSSADPVFGRKALFWTGGRGERYARITLNATGGASLLMESWRLLMLKTIQPPDNIEIGARFGIDDRSDRRYSRSGRINVDPTIIVPTFQGGWPWIEYAQFRSDFKPLMMKKGGSYPVYFCMDKDESTWGEDETIYGYLEKQQDGVYEDGNLMSFSFSIVGIAP